MIKVSIHSISYTLLLLLVFISCKNVSDTSQANKEWADPDPLRFEKEIAAIQQISFDRSRDRIVFTGSSSIRLWENLQDYYPGYQIINTGFGGSEMSDLSYFLQEAVFRFSPFKVFIYEGDNDLNSGRSTAQILNHAEHIISMIQQQLPACKIYFISPKPSPARWHLRDAYVEFNNTLTKALAKYPNCTFIDVWPVMLNDKQEVKPEIFTEDKLHLNAAGYDLWGTVIKEFVETK
jgi:GDSL-like Lipase/Acylhydrolase family